MRTRKLSYHSRIEYDNEYIVEKVWISDIDYTSSNTLYSGCYVKKWYLKVKRMTKLD